jgi:peptide/nickel transport system substrate-binding protein
MKKWFIFIVAALSMVTLLSPCTPQAASPTTATIKKSSTSLSKDGQPQSGGIWKVLMRTNFSAFGYPPQILGQDRDFAPPFFDHLLNVGDDGKYQPGLALRWDISKDGRSITFKLRQGVTFHDGTTFNAQAVKSNLDNLIPPKATILPGITSVDVVDDYTVKLNLPSYNNLLLHYFATNPATYIYSPEALKKNGADWAKTHPVGTGPFLLKDYQPNISLAVVKNPNYWQKGLPYLDGIEMIRVPDAMTQMIAFKAGQAHAIYAAVETTAVQLRDQGYPIQMGSGTVQVINFDIKNSEILSKSKVREAIEYAIDKEAICKGPGEELYEPMYQIVSRTSPDYNKACPSRKYDPAKAKKLLAEAGYPNGFSFKFYIQDTAWKDGFVAIQSYLAKVGIKMDINYVNNSAYSLIRVKGTIDKGATSYQTIQPSLHTLYMLDSSFRSDSLDFPYIVKPDGIDKLIDQAKTSRNPADVTRINGQILKLLYDNETVVHLWQHPRIAILDKSVQNTGWFICGDPENNQFGTRTWLKK